MLYFHSHIVADGSVIYIFRCETKSGGVAPTMRFAGTSCMWKSHMLLLPSNIIRLQCSPKGSAGHISGRHIIDRIGVGGGLHSRTARWTFVFPPRLGLNIC